MFGFDLMVYIYSPFDLFKIVFMLEKIIMEEILNVFRSLAMMIAMPFAIRILDAVAGAM